MRWPIASRVPFSSATPKTSFAPLPPPRAFKRPVCATSALSSILRSARASRRGAVREPAWPSRPMWRATALPGSLRAWFCCLCGSVGALFGFGTAARTISGRGLISSASPALVIGGTVELQNFIPNIMRIAATDATSTPFQSACSPPTRATPRTRRMRSERLPLVRTATARCGSGTTSPCASAWLRPRTRSSGPPTTWPSSSRKSCSGRGAATVQPFTSLRRTAARSIPCSIASQPGWLPARSRSPGKSCQTLTRVSPQNSSASAHSPPAALTGGRTLHRAGAGVSAGMATAALSCCVWTGIWIGASSMCTGVGGGGTSSCRP